MRNRKVAHVFGDPAGHDGAAAGGEDRNLAFRIFGGADIHLLGDGGERTVALVPQVTVRLVQCVRPGDLEIQLGNELELLVEDIGDAPDLLVGFRSEEHTSELQSLMRISYAVFCLKKTT